MIQQINCEVDPLPVAMGTKLLARAVLKETMPATPISAKRTVSSLNLPFNFESCHSSIVYLTRQSCHVNKSTQVR